MKIIFPLLVFLLVMGCNEEEKLPPPEIHSERSFSDTINFKYSRKITLLPEAQEQISTWLAYATAKNEIESMTEATGTELVQNSEPLVQIMEALNETMPDSLKVPAVKARANVLLTKAHLLHQKGTKKYPNPDELFETAKEIIREFGNFKIQLNELFIKTPEDFEQELEEVFEKEQDSISSGSMAIDSIS